MNDSAIGDDHDRELVNKFIRSRDERSFRVLYRRHTPGLYRLALRLVGGVEVDAQDVIQDTWLRASRGLAEFEWKSSLRTWLTGILINCVRELDRARQRRREDELLDLESFARQSSNGPPEIEQMILRLPAGCRQVLTLHDIEGYTHDEISTLLEIGAGTSKSQLHYARQILKSALQEGRKTNEQDNGRQA